MHTSLNSVNISKCFEPFQKEIFEKCGIEAFIEFRSDNDRDSFHITDKNNLSVTNGSPLALSWFYLSILHGCCGVCVSHGSYIVPTYRRKGIGEILNRFRIALAKAGKYGMLICTDVDFNTPQKKILAKNGWQSAAQFFNPKSGNLVNLHYVDLNKIPS